MVGNPGSLLSFDAVKVSILLGSWFRRRRLSLGVFDVSPSSWIWFQAGLLCLSVLGLVGALVGSVCGYWDVKLKTLELLLAICSWRLLDRGIPACGFCWGYSLYYSGVLLSYLVLLIFPYCINLVWFVNNSCWVVVSANWFCGFIWWLVSADAFRDLGLLEEWNCSLVVLNVLMGLSFMKWFGVEVSSRWFEAVVVVLLGVVVVAFYWILCPALLISADQNPGIILEVDGIRLRRLQL